MADPQTKGEIADGEIQPTPKELAHGWLAFRTSEVSREMGGVEALVSFTETYTSKTPGSLPAAMQGSSVDEEDWLKEVLEYDQWQYERQDELEVLYDKLHQLRDELSTIGDHRKQIDGDDLELITRLSKLETQRREDIEVKRKREEARVLGVEFVGTQDLSTQLGEFVSLVRSGQIVEHVRAPNGWELARHYPAEVWHRDIAGLEDGKNPEQFQVYWRPNAQDSRKKVSMRIYAGDDGSYTLDIEDFRNPEDAVYANTKAIKGRSLSFAVREGRVFGPAAASVIEETKYGYPESHREGPALPFEQSTFDEVKGLIDNMVADFKASSKTP